MEKVMINIAKDFTRYPGGRTVSDGPYSGEHFRDRFLLPHIRKGTKIELVIDDGVLGYGSSFLEECFGGLVRQGFKSQDVLGLLDIQYTNPAFEMYKQEIIEYIIDADR